MCVAGAWRPGRTFRRGGACLPDRCTGCGDERFFRDGGRRDPGCCILGDAGGAAEVERRYQHPGQQGGGHAVAPGAMQAFALARRRSPVRPAGGERLLDPREEFGGRFFPVASQGVAHFSIQFFSVVGHLFHSFPFFRPRCGTGNRSLPIVVPCPSVSRSCRSLRTITSPSLCRARRYCDRAVASLMPSIRAISS